ncbi:3-hydroxyacyl-CoA dehydrogenase family protein, partial [Chloroflexota bacterium]
LVEVIGGTKTSPAVMEKVAQVLRGCRKRVVVQKLELPKPPAGWGNAIQHPLGGQARLLVDEYKCPIETVDDLIRFGFGRRLTYTANFMRQDLLGLDFYCNIAKAAGREPWGPHKERVERGELGMKSGKGFYDWSGNKAKEFMRDFDLELIRLLKRDMEKGDI